MRAIARLLSRIEAGGAPAAEVAGRADRASRAAPASLGLTGPPGVGKSTLTTAMIGGCAPAGRRVAVLAVDPSSPFSGGALLGDRVRMGAARHRSRGVHPVDVQPGRTRRAFRGRAGAADLFSADRVRRRARRDCRRRAERGRRHAAGRHGAAWCSRPGMGDGIQAAKAGILEIADVLVVNKADHDGASTTVRDLQGR